MYFVPLKWSSLILLIINYKPYLFIIMQTPLEAVNYLTCAKNGPHED